jgi:hypothetical protein
MEKHKKTTYTLIIKYYLEANHYKYLYCMHPVMLLYMIFLMYPSTQQFYIKQTEPHRENDDTPVYYTT